MKETEVNVKSKRINKMFKYALVFIIPIVCMIIHMALKECYPFGNNTILIGDANGQYYSFFMELSDRIKNGKSLFFSWDSGMGYDFYSNFFYYLASPFNIIAMFFGRSHMELGMIITMLVQIGGCGVTMLYYLAHTRRNKLEHSKLNDAVCILFALSYAMCDYILSYQYNIIWLISLLLLPLVMLGIEKLVEDNDVRLYFVTLFFVFITNFYFAWFICIFAVIWFIDQKKSGIKMCFKSFVRFALSSIVSAMCAAVVLIPCYLAVLGREDKWVTLSDYPISTFGKISNFIQSFFWGHSIDTLGEKMFTNNNYCGVFVPVLCLLFVFVDKIDRRQRIKRAVEIVFLVVSMNWIGTIYVFHGFTIPHMFLNRFGFILIILMLVTAFECINNYDKVHLKWILAVIALCILAIVTVFLKNNFVQSLTCYMVSILLIVYLLVLFILFNRKSIKRLSVIINIIVIGFAEIISNFFFVNGESFDVSIERKGASSKWADTYNEIQTDNMERKTAWVFSQNNITYSDTNFFASSINSNLLWLFERLGLLYQTNGGSYAYRGATPVTSLMFNVKNVISDSPAYYGGYNVTETYDIYNEVYDFQGTYGVYQTDYIAGLGYVVPSDVLNWATDSLSPFEVQNDFVECISGVSGVFTKVETDSLTEFAVLNNGCKIFENTVWQLEKKSDNVKFYQNLMLDESSYALINYYFIAPSDMHLYAYIKDRRQTLASLYIGGKPVIADSMYPAPAEMLDLGELKAGQEVIVSVYNNSSLSDKGATVIDFYEYHDDKMQECMKQLDGQSMNILEFDDTYIKGGVELEETGVLYTSIPYWRGFNVYVDGIKADITGIGNDALIGVKLSAGSHIVEFKYIPYGFRIGLIISGIGLFIVVCYMITRYRKGEKTT